MFTKDVWGRGNAYKPNNSKDLTVAGLLPGNHRTGARVPNGSTRYRGAG